MKLTNAKIGNKYFGIIYKYSFRFMKGIKLVEFEVVKINPKTVGIVFDSETRKYPQLMKKEEDNSCININAKELLEDYLNFLNTSKFPKYLKDKIRRYCLRKIKQIGNESKRQKRLRLNQVEDAELFSGGFACCPFCGSKKLKEKIYIGASSHWYCYSCDSEFNKAIFIKDKDNGDEQDGTISKNIC